MITFEALTRTNIHDVYTPHLSMLAWNLRFIYLFSYLLLLLLTLASLEFYRENTIQYTLANPNRGVPISEFVRISEVTLFLWRYNNTKICDNPMLPV